MNLIPKDTTIDALRKQYEILERIGIEGRAKMTFELSDKARQKVIDDIEKEHPEFIEKLVKLEVIRRCYGDELAQKVAAWKGWKE
jgi:predicted ArsR family transcriptional regulator